MDRRTFLQYGIGATALGILGPTAPTASAQSNPAATKYRGQTVRFLTVRNVHQLALADAMAEIAKGWGIDLQTRFITTDQLQKKVVVDFTGGADTWDLVYCGGIQRMYEWFDGGVISDIAPLIKSVGDQKFLEWDKFTPAAQKAVQFGNYTLGLTVGTSDQAMSYRRDLFEHPEEKTAFKAKYGYDLQAPQTYAQYRDAAEFFTRKKGQKLAGKPLSKDFYGLVLSNKKGTFLWHKTMNLFMAFGVDLYDSKTGKPGVDSPQAIQAAKFYHSLLPFLPEAHINMSSGEEAEMFAAGGAALTIEYFDRLLNANEKVGEGLTPGSFAYTLPPSVPGAPYGRKNAFRSGPPVVSMFGRARSPEAAYKLLEAAVATERQIAMTRAHPGYHPSKEPAMKALIQREPVVGYLLQAASPSVSAMTDVDVMPYPGILVASKIGDVVSEAMAAILIGAAPETELAKAQAELVAAYKELKPARPQK